MVTFGRFGARKPLRSGEKPPPKEKVESSDGIISGSVLMNDAVKGKLLGNLNCRHRIGLGNWKPSS